METAGGPPREASRLKDSTDRQPPETGDPGRFTTWSWCPLLFGASLLSLWFIPGDTWAGWFSHPMRTAPGSPVPEVTLQGIRLLRIMLPVAGLCWITAGIIVALGMRGRTPSHKTEDSSRIPFRWAIITGLLVAAFVIRLPLLGQGLWYDEIVAFWYYGQHGPGPILGNMFTPANHVLQSLGSWASVSISGGSLEEWTLRLPALLAGLLSTWPIYIIGRRALGSTGAIIAVAVILFMPIAIIEGTEARGYALMLLFGSSSSALLLCALEDRRIELLPLYALACTLGIWSHLVTVVVPAGHALLLVGVLLASNDRRRICLQALGAIALAAVTTLLVLAPVIPDLLQARSDFTATSVDQPTLLGAEGRMILFGLGGAWPIRTMGISGALVGACLALLGLHRALSDQRLRRSLLVTGLPILVALLLVGVLGTWIYARFMVFGLSFVAIAVTGGLLWLNERSKGAVVVAGICLGIGWSIVVWSQWTIPRQPIRELVQRIPNDGSLVASSGVKDMALVVAWYLPEARNRVIDADAQHEDAAQRLEDPRIEWVIHAYPRKSGSWPANIEGMSTLPGWIDQMDGSLLLERKKKPSSPDQS